MRLAVDAMGGDLGPQTILRGAKLGLEFLADDDELLLFGPEDLLAEQCRELDLTDARVSHVHCSEVIGMDESPVEAVRQKRDSTITRMVSAAGKGEIDAVISAGNTGALAAGCQFRIKTIEGVSRPGIGVVIPTFHGPVFLCDAGANVAPKSRHLYEYAKMGVCYSRVVLGNAQPRVGLVSIGEEASKGNTLVREARALIEADSTLEFIGNVEGRDIFTGVGDVFICDGFVGNVILKLTEGLAEGIFKTIDREIAEEAEDLLPAFEKIVDRIWKRHDFAEHGGAPLLGVNSIAIICHGRSDQRAIANAIRVAVEQHRAQLNQVIAEQMRTQSSGDAT